MIKEKSDAVPAAPGSSPASRKKPWLSLAFATSGGLGYLPAAPGTFGSVVGVAVAYVMSHFDRVLVVLAFLIYRDRIHNITFAVPYMFYRLIPDPNFVPSAFAFVVIAMLGVWTSSRVARYSGQKDPQFVVIDEVSGQHLTLLLGGMLPLYGVYARGTLAPWSTVLYPRHPNWIILLAGLILFRVFDIWKPFPARQAESLPSGWGIMADDWVAGIYAAICLWLLRAAGL
jgi:phosphatidylglycerophosphatase A